MVFCVIVSSYAMEYTITNLGAIDGHPFDAFAINDICTHEHTFLSDGVIEDGCVECPLHQALFDVRTGKALTAPAIVDVKTYLTKIENNVVFVQL